MKRSPYQRFFAGGCLVVAGVCATGEHPRGQASDVKVASGVPLPGLDGWGTDDERGNGNTQGLATRLRCAAYLAHPTSRVYELGRVRYASITVC
jgi:hypothetical protein